jgi:uncharacterized membrane protein
MPSQKTDASQPPAKPWWKSRAVIGAVVAILASLLGMVGVSIDEATLTEIVVHVIGAAGGAVAIYGRVKAKHPLGP